ncbi:MAG TPA: hypothetical protein VF837_04545 [Patescibacteria group bacterium]
MKKYSLLILALVLLFSMAACSTESGITQNKSDTDWQLQQYNQVQRMHVYTYSWERWIVQTIYDFRITKLTNTWAVWVGDGTGEPIDYCASKGYGIPYSTSLTSPDQVYYNSSGAVVAMMEPNGLYPSGNTLATWVLCIETDGSLHPTYVEPQVIVYDHPISIALDKARGMYRIVRAGTASEDTKIVLPSNFDPKILDKPPVVP